LPIVGYIHPSAADRNQDTANAFEEGLKQTGYTSRENVSIEYRWANDDYSRLPELVQNLVDQKVAVILAATPVAALAAKRGTLSIPIVFCVGSDPIRDGLVASLNSPGSNITGTTFFADLLSAKRLALLHELVGSNAFAVLVNPKNVNAELEVNDTKEAARSLGLQLVFADASTEKEINDAVPRFRGQGAAALLVESDAFLNLHAREIATLTLQHGLATCFSFREPVAAGGLMSYGASRVDAYRRAAVYVGRILHGEKAANLPVQQPTKFDFVLNLKTAKMLGLVVPASMQLLADEVIE
jgi:putative tryptophan/tyrosine transport system substrate-binding protein